MSQIAATVAPNTSEGKRLSPAEFFAILPGLELICFDLFDTLVERTVHPEYVKEIATRTLSDTLGLSLSIDELHTLRSRLEIVISNHHVVEGHDQEFRLYLLGKSLHLELLRRGIAPRHFNEPEFVSLFMEIEQAVDLAHQRIRDEGMALLRRVSTHEKNIALVSDTFYAPRHIRHFLRAHKFEDLFSYLFLSSENLKTKRTGRLYQHILQTLDISPSKVAMIGDRDEADDCAARRQGMHTCPLPQSRHSWYDEQRSSAHTSLHVWRQADAMVPATLPFRELTFSLWYFCRELHRRAADAEITELFFISREGAVLKELFEVYQRTLAAPNQFTTHYLIASRRSTFIPSLKELSQERFERLFREYRSISALEFLQSLGATREEAIAITTGISEREVRQSDFPSSESFQQLCKSQPFADWYERRRAAQRKNLTRYLRTFPFPENDRAALVDVGWKGTIQDNLFSFFNNARRQLGFYLGLLPSGRSSPENIKNGVLFSAHPSPSAYYHVYEEGLSLFEILLAAPHGSARAYAEDGTPICEENEAEATLYRETIAPLLDQIKSAFASIARHFASHHYDAAVFLPHFARAHARMVLTPTREELSIVKKVVHYENFGLFRYTKFSGTMTGSWRQNLVTLARQPKALLNATPWPALSLDEAGLPALRLLYAKRKELWIFEPPPNGAKQKVYHLLRQLKALVRGFL